MPRTAERSCCNVKVITERSETASCCAEKPLVKQDCGKCRCHEQMQIVVLSGYSVGVSTLRTTVAMAVKTSPDPERVVAHPVFPLPEFSVPPNVVLLKTCTLLI